MVMYTLCAGSKISFSLLSDVFGDKHLFGNLKKQYRNHGHMLAYYEGLGSLVVPGKTKHAYPLRERHEFGDRQRGQGCIQC